MSIDCSEQSEKAMELIFQRPEESTSGEEPSMSEWSSLIVEEVMINQKKALHRKGLYNPGSGNICSKYIPMSASSVFRHAYYNYPPVSDPGIKEALFQPEKPFIYPDDGQELYIALCVEMNMHPVRLFYTNLLCEEINLSYYGVNPLAIHPMSVALHYNKCVHKFNLTDNFLSDDACYHLGQMMYLNVTIRELNLAGCRIGASGLLRIGETLPNNRSLIVLNLARNALGDKGGLYFAKLIFDGATVTRINLSNNGLGKETALALADSLQYNNKLTHVDLSWNVFFNIPSIVKLLNEFGESTVLEELNLAFNALEGNQVGVAIKNILKLRTLKVLDLSNNRFHGQAITNIGQNLVKAKQLVTLDLSSNPLTPDDAYGLLLKMLKPKVKLDNLLLENVCVHKNFISCLGNIRKMSCRGKFVVKYGAVLQNWTIVGIDARKTILQRADYLCSRDKKCHMDIALFILRLYKKNPRPIAVKDFTAIMDAENTPLDEDLVAELANLFPGPKSTKAKYIDVGKICEYIRRLWPEKKLPPTPPPELISDTEPEPFKEEEHAYMG